MPLKKKPNSPKLPTPVDSHKHKDKRANIPTEELRDFIVRHAYFTGAGNPYDKLKRALRAEIDESAWSALYSTQSYPFEMLTSGKIAVKVINHYGDEVLKVYDVR